MTRPDQRTAQHPSKIKLGSKIRMLHRYHASNLALATLLLAACVPLTQDQIARETARNVVRPILADRFPGLPLEPVTDCVIDNASAGELYSLAQTSVTGFSVEALNAITRITTRPATVQCIAAVTPALILQTRRP
jgi:hypothetical protein